jgi:transposase-like protein
MSRTHEECLAYLEQIRWNGTPTCPYCGSTNSTAYKQEHRYHCNSCFTSYSVTVGTLFHRTRIELQKWFTAIPLVLNSKGSISIRQLARELGVNKNTAAYMVTRICRAMNEEAELLRKIIYRSDT